MFDFVGIWEVGALVEVDLAAEAAVAEEAMDEVEVGNPARLLTSPMSATYLVALFRGILTNFFKG